ncbi:sulfatase [Arthrobacter sp. ISL-30]|uniref:sulfatase family protein n=1 Tax=Arthrobacter sp. ISL-30 TaxID=2819109 RepID=UPI001BE77E3C|nr:sulfatase [Arthrobacter sp. ISL-30]MBT2513626.1 sulfatase [Arthrobacter sp. ISL-30]
MKQPNVLWISTHDINPDLGCYSGVWPGAEYAVTPNLDRLAQEGARFDLAFASAPVCAPARSAIYTGCFPTAIGTMHMRTKAVPPPEVHLLPEYFRQQGYYCTNNVFTDFQVDVPSVVFDELSPTAHWRKRPDPSTPFFAAFHGMTTHESRIYLDDDAFARETEHVADTDRHYLAAAPLPPYYPDTPVFRRSWARYADLITEMDHWVGTILDQLEEDGLAENTIVVFWSDHGRGMPRAKRWATEAGLREPLLIRWPGMIEPGTVRTDLVHTMDLAPTMLQACGLPVPPHMHGTPLLTSDGSFIDNPNKYVYGGRDRMDEAEDTTRTVRDKRFRYTRHYHPDRSPMQHTDYPDNLATWAEFRRLASEEARQLACGEKRSQFTKLQRTLVAAFKAEEELYDLTADPHETRNLAKDPGHAPVIVRMREVLGQWQERYGDLGLLAEDELIEGWRPAGKVPSTAAPQVVPTPKGLVACCLTPGSSIGWTTDAPGPVRESGLMDRAIGVPADDGRSWHLYTAPVTVTASETVWFKAWRLGYRPSADVAVSVPVHA